MKVKEINILLADDHVLFAKLMERLLKNSKELKVVSIVHDSDSVLKSLKKQKIDILLLDIDLPKIDGLKLLPIIIGTYRETKVIMLSNHTEQWIIQKAMQSGASGYLTKFAEEPEVLEAIRAVMKGEIYYCKLAVKNLLKKFTNNNNGKDSKDNKDTYSKLTKREKQILGLLAKEYTTKDIAETLIISIRTVESHRRHLLQKLSSKNTAGLIKNAIDAKIIEVE